MSSILLIFQIFLSISLCVLILLQSRGTGFARGGGGSTPSFTRRGLEKVVFRLTFILSGLFLIFSILSITL
ncbi:preprotein translocase subunit SecG [Candidatus Woesebacteria bacterium RIFCSPLOWO2_01_FULL_39_14]|uniref:Protein-export membrane protein SecG n=1 Tax=Candidatus Woesebacteria bacterium RIFCSPLOWO2_01_FULL_39_14 TaxID=1802518 RepID=A0A1F8BH99_9BACT|nr:MAG: preprotein translocase subunit SecG [Candidatus Woesebacteria bacterium RIFCSPLOWO2_01_FULL_39_14]